MERLAVLCFAALFLAACGRREDPRLVLCRAAVRDSVEGSDPITWLSADTDDIDDADAVVPEPEVDGRVISEVFVPAAPDRYVVSLEYEAVVDVTSRVRGDAECKFRPDAGRGLAASSVLVAKRPFEPAEIDRLTERYLPEGAWRAYACQWYRFWEEECRVK